MYLPCNLRQRNKHEWTFLNWYIHAAGKSKIPIQYHLWCALSLISAAAAHKVWFEKTRGERLYANLYVMLIGASGTGKNRAISRATRRVDALGKWEQEEVHLYMGKITPQCLFNVLGDKKKKKANIWIATPELRMSVGSGGKADDWVTHMAELHAGNMTYQDTTRGSGQFKIEDACVSWVSGSNIPWLLKAIPIADIKGGFFARVCPIFADRNPVRTARVTYPNDYDVVTEWIAEYLSYLTHFKSEIREDEHAAELFDWWIMNRAEPTDELLWNFWEQDVRVNQLAMLLALADNFRTVVTYDDMRDAINLFEWVQEQFKYVVSFVARGPESENHDQVVGYLRGKGSVTHALLVRFGTDRGIARDKLKMIVATLVDQGDVRCVENKTLTERTYTWIG